MTQLITQPFSHRFFAGGFPASQTIDGVEFTFKTDFRIWLRYDCLINEAKLTVDEKVKLATALCLVPPINKNDLVKGFEAAAWFYKTDTIDQGHLLDQPALAAHKERFEQRRADIERGIIAPAEDFGYSPRDYSPFWDYRAIWGAFKAHFNMDLFTADLHWWAFLALIQELPTECSFSNLRRLRMKTKKDMPPDQWGDHRINRILCSTPRSGVL